MALASSVTGDGYVIDGSIQTRYYTTNTNIGGGAVSQTWKEVKTTETREWVAVTRAAADAYVAANTAHPTPGTGSYSYSKSEQDRRVGSWSVRRMEEVKTVELYVPEE